jgi:hypothetical protein
MASPLRHQDRAMTVNLKLDLAACQCPLCFHSVPLDGVQIIGACPKCGLDTRWVIFKMRYPWRWWLVSLFPNMKVNLSHIDAFPA